MTEDTVECFYFSAKPHDIDRLCIDLNEVIRLKCEDYIWHKDSLKVIQPVKVNTQDSLEHLYSSTCFGDNIEDEWFIVYLVYEISKLYPQLIVHVQDSDGEFLMIESADNLPKWCKPEIMNNRVFIHNGNIHIIPPDIFPANKEISVKEAVTIVSEQPQSTQASPQIQAAILKRIGAYPAKIKDNKHKAIVRLPIELAALLHLKPSLISWLVHAFCQHDVIDARCFKKSEFKDYVNVQVTFTKCLYAMLLHSNLKSRTLNSLDKPSLLGQKLTYGYKILLNEPNSDIYTTKDYKRFIKNLTDNGYFNGYLEHSKDYCKLLEKANTFYASAESPRNVLIKKEICDIKDQPEFTNAQETVSQCLETLTEDSDDWLTIDSDELNNILNTQYKKNNLSPQDLTNELSKFLNKPSDLEGIEIIKEDSEPSDDELNIDVNLFAESLQKMLNFVAPNGENIEQSDSSSSSDEELCDIDAKYDCNQIDEEIQKSLCSDVLSRSSADIKNNTIQNLSHSIKGERGFPGPTSTILRHIGVNKNDMLDSDDDLDYE